MLSCFDGRPALTRVGEVAIRRNPAESADYAARDRAFINVAFHVLTVRKGRSRA